MKSPQENHEPASVADLQDRLIDRALAEVVGGNSPPDLAARVLADRAKLQEDDPRSRRWYIALLVVAATVLVAVTIALSQVGQYKQTARSSAGVKMANETAVPQPSESLLGGGRLISDASVPNSEENGLLRAQLKSGIRDRGKAERYPGRAGAEFPPASTVTAIDGRFVAKTPQGILKHTDAKELVLNNLQLGRPVPAGGPMAANEPSLSPGQQSRNRSISEESSFGMRFQISASPGDKISHYYLDDDSGPVAGMRQNSFRSDWGIGPQASGDQYARIYENPFVKAIGGDAVSTFSIDVDTASYANVRQFLMEMRQLPPTDAVRIEELVNYFHYDYAGPKADDEAPFAAHVEVAGCPWAPKHRLVRIGIKGREIERDHRPPSNLVFLVDVSGSMDEPNKLPLVVDGLRQLTHELGENDRVAIVVYASSEGLALESTRGDNQAAILGALDRLKAGGSTAGGAGIQLAYQLAEDHFIPGGTNRVILCTDGDFNVGVTSTAELERLVTQKAKDTRVFLSVLGFGRGNLNDAMMQTIADRGNGNHHYVDDLREARKVLVEEMSGTLVTIAKDVKIQVEFNPAQVAGYRLLGYENRLLRTEDFNDDTKDAGEIGAGHTVTALYEVMPAGEPVGVPAVDELKYQPTPDVGGTNRSVEKLAADNRAANAATDKIVHPTDMSRELLTLKMRYKQPEGDVSRKLEWPTTDDGKTFDAASDDFRFAAAVASFGLVLRDSEYRGDAAFDMAAEIAQSSLGEDRSGYRAEFVDLARRAKELQPNR
jgi:Ca-activated chloride channel family protein